MGAHRVAKMHHVPTFIRSLSAKEPPFKGLFCGKRPIRIRHPMHLDPVSYRRLY